jgi:hypothetical protein
MAPITVSTEIDAPAGAVFAYATDPTRFTEWQEGVVDGRLEGSGPTQRGTLCRTTRRIGGRTQASLSEVTHIDPPRTWGVHGLDGPIRATVDLTVEPLAATRSRLTIRVDFDGHGIGKILVPLVVQRQARSEMPANVARLKQRVEAAQPERDVPAPGRSAP